MARNACTVSRGLRRNCIGRKEISRERNQNKTQGGADSTAPPDLSRDDRTPSGIKNKCTSAPDCTACRGDCFYPRWAYPPKDGRSDETGNAGMRSPIDENENLCIDSEYYSLQKRIKRHFLFSDAGFFTSASLKDDSWHHRQFQNAAFSIHARLTA